MSTYYEYRDVKVAMALALMKKDGWTVYGYHNDNSDPMTDYYDPACWEGIATKNGYTLVVDDRWGRKEQEIRSYNPNFKELSYSDKQKIEQLSEMRVDRGCTEAEETQAQRIIERIKEKSQCNEERYIVTGIIPAYMPNPPRCNWHIEKDGQYIDKGNGLLKFSSLDYYYRYDREVDEKDRELMDKFETLINRIDTACGNLLSNTDDDIYTYEEVTVTEYKKEIKAVKVDNGEVKEGQCFILNTRFNYGRNKGYVYRIKAKSYEGSMYYNAVKLNNKLTKECNGAADASNHWFGIGEDFAKWINKGAISWCELQEVSTPYEVKKVVKRRKENPNKETYSKKKCNTNTTKEEKSNLEGCKYEVVLSEHTKTKQPIWLLKLKDNLSRETFLNLKRQIGLLGGYYSKFTHSFVFNSEPSQIELSKLFI